MTTQQPDRLLTNDALVAIAARAEAATEGPWEPFYHDDKTIERSTFIGFGVSGPPEAYKEPFAVRADAEFIAHARADIPPLLAHIRAQDAEIARLRDALGAVVDAETHGIPGGYIGVYPDETDRYCTYCLTSWRMGEPERHDDDCPIAAARELNQRETEAVENALMQRINELEAEVSKAATEYAMLLETNRAHLRERGELVMALRAALRTIEQLAAENPLTAHDTGIARALAAARALLDGGADSEGGA